MTKKGLAEKLRQITDMKELSEFIDQLEKRERSQEVKRKIGATKGRKVYCPETDTTYDSIGHAADVLGIKYHQSVSTAATHGGTTNGYHFKYV